MVGDQKKVQNSQVVGLWNSLWSALGEPHRRTDASENPAVNERMKKTQLPLVAGTRFNNRNFFELTIKIKPSPPQENCAILISDGS